MTDKCVLDDWNGIAARLNIVARNVGFICALAFSACVPLALAIFVGPMVPEYVFDALALIIALLFAGAALFICCAAVAIFIRWIFCKESSQ